MHIVRYEPETLVAPKALASSTLLYLSPVMLNTYVFFFFPMGLLPQSLPPEQLLAQEPLGAFDVHSSLPTGSRTTFLKI
jgi:hypothetical protein